VIDALAIAREHLATRDREASDTECSECGMRNPPSRPASACGMEFLTHDGCPAAGGAFIPAVSPWGRRQCLGVAESDAVCEAVVALTAEVERLRAEFAASQPALAAIRRGPVAMRCPGCGAPWADGACPSCELDANAPDRDLCARCGKLALDHECEAPRAPGDGTDGA